MFTNIRKFFLEVVAEIKKVSWSTPKELVDATWLVVLSSVFLGLFIWVADTMLAQFLGLLIR